MPHLTGWFVSEEVAGHNHKVYEESANNPDIYIEAEKYGTIAQLMVRHDTRRIPNT